MNAAIQHFTPAQLFEHLGVSLFLVDGELHVLFASGQTECWVPAPDGYPVDGSRELITFSGRHFVPEAQS